MAFRLITLLFLVLGGVIPDVPPAGVAANVWANYKSIPRANSRLRHFDAIIVLGMPTKPDGTIAPETQARMEEGIREYRAGVAAHLIPTGGAAHNQYYEAHAMEEYAVAHGVPADAVIEEDQAKDTIQNIWFAHKIMLAHGWHSAEVVSSPSHLPRTALILEHYKDLQWRTQASQWPPVYSESDIASHFAREARMCWKLTHGGFPPSDDLPQ